MTMQHRLGTGFVWGVVATLAMSLLMLVGMLSGLAPMPRPIPVALMGTLLGGAAPKPLLLVLAIGSHLLYGGLWGAVAAALIDRITIWTGLALGVVLWLIMQVVVLPYLGWGLFGTALTPQIAAATLFLHLVYGATLGAGVDREGSAAQVATS